MYMWCTGGKHVFTCGVHVVYKWCMCLCVVNLVNMKCGCVVHVVYMWCTWGFHWFTFCVHVHITQEAAELFSGNTWYLVVREDFGRVERIVGGSGYSLKTVKQILFYSSWQWVLPQNSKTILFGGIDCLFFLGGGEFVFLVLNLSWLVFFLFNKGWGGGYSAPPPWYLRR